jgi:hypothetical protein
LSEWVWPLVRLPGRGVYLFLLTVFFSLILIMPIFLGLLFVVLIFLIFIPLMKFISRSDLSRWPAFGAAQS